MGDIDVELYLFDETEPAETAEFDYRTIARLTEEEFAERVVEQIEDAIPEEGEVAVVFDPADGETVRRNWVSLNRGLPREQEIAYMIHDMLVDWRREEDDHVE